MGATAEHDLVIRGGAVADGTGAPLWEGDIAVRNGLISDLGRVQGQGREEVDARGLLVTPGFVDLHTHYDGQVSWDQRLVPSSWHGVTTVVMGNCGVGFAPVRPADQDRLLALMEGVEDIPGAVLKEGLDWRWDSYASWLDMIEAQPRDVDICTQLAHGPLRIFAMGERATAFEPATPADIAAMRALTTQAMQAGAFGFSTTRTINHRSASGENTPCYRAREDELCGIAAGLADAGHGVLQFISDWGGGEGLEAEFGMMTRVARTAGRPLSFSLAQLHATPDDWRRLLALTDEAVASGLDIRAQVAPRSIAVLLGLQSSLGFFNGCPSYDALAPLPLADKLALMRTPEFRARLLAEPQRAPDSPIAQRLSSAEHIFVMGDPPQYEPTPGMSLAAIARRQGRTPAEVAYDHLVAGDGRQMLFAPINNYLEGNLDRCRDMLAHPRALLGLGDGGAHVSFVCDASFTTFMLTHWARDRSSGRFPVEWAVKRLSADNARHMGLRDRGEIARGLRADLNVIDLGRLTSTAPYMAADLPCGGKRLLQQAVGYRRTIVNGVTTYVDGEPTGALPGRLLRAGRA